MAQRQKDPCGLCRCRPAMCTTSTCDLEEIPLDDEDPNSIEFKILEFYVKRHVFKKSSAVCSPKLLRTRSLSQRGLGIWSANESWTQVPWPCRHSQSSEKPINLAKKKSSWRTLLGGGVKEEASQSSLMVIQAESQSILAGQDGLPTQQSPRSPSNVQQCLEPEGRLLGASSSPTTKSFPSLCAWWFISSQLLPWPQAGHSSCFCFPSYYYSRIIALLVSRLSREEKDGSEVWQNWFSGSTVHK